MKTCLLAFALALFASTFAVDASADAPAKRGSAPPSAHRPSTSELRGFVESALAASPGKLPKGASLVGVRATNAALVPALPGRVTLEVTPLPRRPGRSDTASTSGVLTFWNDDATEIKARVTIALDVSLSREALTFDVAKGRALTLVVQRGFVEVTAPAVAAADADIGDVVQVLLRPSGRAIRARIVAKDRALAVEDSQ